MSQRAELEKTRPGDPWPCPECGKSEWLAHYMVPENQGVTLVIGADGNLDIEDYSGVTDQGESEDNDHFECMDCGAMIDPVEGTLLPDPDQLPLAFNLPDGGPA